MTFIPRYDTILQDKMWTLRGMTPRMSEHDRKQAWSIFYKWKTSGEIQTNFGELYNRYFFGG